MISNNVIKIFENIDKNTAFRDNIIVWMGLRACDYSMIKFMNPDLIASTRYGEEIVQIEDKYSIFSTEKNTKIRTDSHMGELIPHIKSITDYVLQYKDVNTYFVCYHSTPELESLARKYPNIHILNPNSYLKKALDNKTFVRQELKKRNIPVIPGIEARMDASLFEPFVKKYDLPFVISYNDSAAGYGVYLIDKKSDFIELAKRTEGMPMSMTKYIDGKSMSISAVRTLDFVIKSAPSMQIIGQPECSNNKFGWCGNDFNVGSIISDEELASMDNITDKVGAWINKLNYRGIFGIDFISDGTNVYFTEINPRFLGTSSLLIDRQIENGTIPLSFFHLVPYMNGLYIDEEFVNEYHSQRKPLDVSQIMLHNTSGKDVTLSNSIRPGVYSYEDDKLTFIKNGTNISDTTHYEQIVITGDVPLQGTRVLANSDELCKILLYDGVLDKKGKDLKPYAKDLVNKVYSKFILN